MTAVTEKTPLRAQSNANTGTGPGVNRPRSRSPSLSAAHVVPVDAPHEPQQVLSPVVPHAVSSGNANGLSPMRQNVSDGLRVGAHVTDVFAAGLAVASGALSGHSQAGTSVASGVTWATAGLSSMGSTVADRSLSPTALRTGSAADRVQIASTAVADTLNMGAGAATIAAASGSDHISTKTAATVSNSLWIGAGTAGMASAAAAGYKLWQNWGQEENRGTKAVAIGLQFASAAANTAAASFGVKGSVEDDTHTAASWNMAAGALWTVGSLLSMGSTYAAYRARPASQGQRSSPRGADIENQGVN